MWGLAFISDPTRCSLAYRIPPDFSTNGFFEAHFHATIEQAFRQGVVVSEWKTACRAKASADEFMRNGSGFINAETMLFFYVSWVRRDEKRGQMPSSFALQRGHTRMRKTGKKIPTETSRNIRSEARVMGFLEMSQLADITAIGQPQPTSSHTLYQRLSAFTKRSSNWRRYSSRESSG